MAFILSIFRSRSQSRERRDRLASPPVAPPFPTAIMHPGVRTNAERQQWIVLVCALYPAAPTTEV
jgi:hypothetical protein